MLELKTHDEFFEFSHNSVHKLLVPKEIISQLEADFTSIGNFPEIVKDPYILFALQHDQMDKMYYKKVSFCYNNVVKTIKRL